MRVVTSKQMKQIEEQSLAYGQSYLSLMQHAGQAAAQFICKKIDVKGKRVLVLCGRGNNGGDGFVVADYLAGQGANVVVVLTDGQPKTPQAAQMFAVLQKANLPVVQYAENQESVHRAMENLDIIVDGIYGTGFHGSLDVLHAQLCRQVNQAVAAVFALDIPSGANADTGAISEDTICADFTISFHALKPAHVASPACECCGKITVADIGIDEQAHQGIEPYMVIPDRKMVFSILKPRQPDSHKGNYGKLTVIGGSRRYIGAPMLACLSAMRSGVGYVTLASTKTVCSTVAPHLLETVLFPMEESYDGTIHFRENSLLTEQLQRSTAVVFGCGLGVSEDTQMLLDQVIRQANCPILLDADGINLLAKNINVLKAANAPVVITPHLGEMARLTGLPIEQIRADAVSIAAQFAQDHQVTVVLKGHRTVIASPDTVLFVNVTGNAGLAKAGSGDLLAGLIGSLLAQGLAPHLAAACGVYLHGAAADRTAKRLSQYGMLPQDILQDLCGIFLEENR